MRARLGSRLSLAITLAVALSACDTGDGIIRVDVCGDVLVPGEVDALRVSVLDEQRNERQAGVVELVRCPEDSIRSLPVHVELGSVKGSVWIVVQALHDGVEVGRFERLAETDESGGATVSTAITRDCLGVACALGQTCVGGACVLAPVDDPGCGSATLFDVDEPSAEDVSDDAPLYCPADTTTTPGGS